MDTNIIDVELDKYLINNITEIVSDYIGGIIRLSFKDTPHVDISESEFKDYDNAKNVTKIYFLKPITITDNTIFKRYKIAESIYGVPPIIKTTDLSGLFHITGRSYMKLTHGNIGDWDVSKVTDIHEIFKETTYNSPLNKWNVSNVTNMNRAFLDSSYNHPLNKWNVSNVTNMDSTFSDSSYDHPLNKWNVSKVEFMNGMFASSIYNHPLDMWNVSKVIHMEDMFHESAYNQPLNSWDIRKVFCMAGMFVYSIYNHPLNKWDVSNVIDMTEMFANSEFDQTSTNTWVYNDKVFLKYDDADY